MNAKPPLVVKPCGGFVFCGGARYDDGCEKKQLSFVLRRQRQRHLHRLAMLLRAERQRHASHDDAFRTRYAIAATRVLLYGGADSARGGLAQPLHLVMVTSAAQRVQMQIAAGVLHKAVPEIIEAVCLETRRFAVRA